MIISHPDVTEKAVCTLVLFLSTYLYKSGFTTFLQKKNKQKKIGRLRKATCLARYQKYPHGL